METFNDPKMEEISENEKSNMYAKIRAMELERKMGLGNAAGALMGSALNQCAQADAPWRMDNAEAKTRGFRNGVHVTKQQDLANTLKACLEKMRELEGEYPPTRNNSLAITHLEDCITRFEAAAKQLAKDLGYL